jgi:diguanylate cyclase (GGDEF)-like protein
MKLSTSVNKFIARNENFDAREIMRHQFFIYLALINIISSAALIGLIGIFRPDIFLSLQLFIIIFVFSSISLWLYKNHGKLIYCSNVLLGGIFISGLGASLTFLNAYGLLTYAYLSTPILAYFIAGSKSGASWTTITLTAALLALIFKQTIIDIELNLGVDFISSQHAYAIERGMYLGSILVTGICCYLYTYLYYRERKILLKQQEKLLHTINYDDLTGVYNYKKISELAGDIIDNDKYSNQKFAYSFIGIENFKPINDEYGYEFGDKILKALAYRLNKALGVNQTLSRLNGTRFALLTINPDNQEQAQKTVEKLVTQAWQTITMEDKQIEIIASIGTAIYPDDGSSLKEITTNADKKMLNRN